MPSNYPVSKCVYKQETTNKNIIAKRKMSSTDSNVMEMLQKEYMLWKTQEYMNGTDVLKGSAKTLNFETRRDFIDVTCELSIKTWKNKEIWSEKSLGRLLKKYVSHGKPKGVFTRVFEKFYRIVRCSPIFLYYDCVHDELLPPPRIINKKYYQKVESHFILRLSHTVKYSTHW